MTVIAPARDGWRAQALRCLVRDFPCVVLDSLQDELAEMGLFHEAGVGGWLMDSVLLVLGVLDRFPDVESMRTMKGALEGDGGSVSRFFLLALLAYSILAFAGNTVVFVVLDALCHCFVVTLEFFCWRSCLLQSL